MQEQMQKINDLNQTVVANVQKMTELQTNLLTSLMRQQMDMVSLYAESSVKQMQSFYGAKRVQDVLAAQSENAKEFNQQFLANFRNTVELLNESKDKMASLVETSIEETSAKMPVAFKKAA